MNFVVSPLNLARCGVMQAKALHPLGSYLGFAVVINLAQLYTRYFQIEKSSSKDW